LTDITGFMDQVLVAPALCHADLEGMRLLKEIRDI
jgi:hypothetical protein